MNPLRSGYATAISKLASGQMVAAGIPFMAAPVIGRLYSPSDYAPLATFIAISVVIATLSTLQLSNAIISENSDEDAERIAYVCLALTAVSSLICGIVAFAGFAYFASYPILGETAFWLLFLPLAVFSSGSMTTIRTLANRKQAYTSLSLIPLLAAFAVSGTTLGLGFLSYGPAGPMLGFLAGQIIVLVSYGLLFARIRQSGILLTRKYAKSLISRHQRFIRYSLPSSFIGASIMELPVYALTAVGGGTTLGAFSRARFFAGTPFTLIGGAVGEVYRQRASEEYRLNGSCQRTLLRTATMLGLIGIVPVITLAFFGPRLFEILLGPNWTLAGQVAAILAPMFLCRLITAPLAHTLLFTESQGLEFILNLGGAFLAFLSIGIAVFSGWPPLAIITAYSVSMCAMYLLFLFASWRSAKR